jgi:hypothetical protein
MTTIISGNRPAKWIYGVCGLLGVILIVISFTINPGPPPGSSIEDLEAFGHRFQENILWGAWLQAIGPWFIVLFTFALVRFSGAANTVGGWMTFFGSGILMTVSLVEVTFYITALFEPHTIVAPVAMSLISAIQHLFFVIAAPGMFIPLGLIIVRYKIIPKGIGYAAIIIGIAFFLIGGLTITKLILPPAITFLGIVQGIWWLVASVVFIFKTMKQDVF